MRGLVFTVDAILALAAISAALLVANAFSNTQHIDLLAMHVTARDAAILNAKGIELPQELATKVTFDKSTITGGTIITKASKQYYSTCGCDLQTCSETTIDLTADSNCLDANGEVKIIDSWSVK